MSVSAGMPHQSEPHLLPDLFAPLERTVPAILARQAARYGNRRLVTVSGTTFTFAEMLAAAAGYAGALAQAGVKAGDRVAILCGNVPNCCHYLGCAWPAPSRCRSTSPRAARSSNTSSAIAAPGSTVVDAELAGVLPPLSRDRRRSETLWLVGGAGRCPIPPVSRPRRSRRPRSRCPPHAVAPRRHGRDPLHLRHDRAVERRVLPAGAIFLVGALYGGAARSAARATAADDAAAVPHQCAQQLLSGAAAPARRWSSSSVFRCPDSGARLARQGATRNLSARRHGPDAAVAPEPRSTSARTACASRSRPACRREYHRSVHAPLRHCGLSTATARPKPTSSSARRRPSSGRA